MSFHFTLAASSDRSSARAGVLFTPHGAIYTPIFMPVGTQATVKGIHQRELKELLEAPILLGNAYHLYLRPGPSLLKEAGGLHRFMGWEGALLTDSGGYQVYSLSGRRTISEEGVLFYSHRDGSKHLFTPESVISLQRSIGADIMMAFDECTPFPCSYAYVKESMERTHRWWERCEKAFSTSYSLYDYPQALFPIVQGGIHKDLRTISANYVAERTISGAAIGGVCHPTGQLYEITRWVCDILPKDKPRYLMGVGTPEDLLECIATGVDMFDCVLPTRNGRNGQIYTTEGIINIRNKKWRHCFTPLDQYLPKKINAGYTLAYLHHLMRINERLGAQIATLHNLHFFLWLVREARAKIIAGQFEEWKSKLLLQIKQRR